MRIARFEKGERVEKGERDRPRPGGPHNICGVAVHALPGHVRDLTARLRGLEGLEVHAATEDGRLVVTIEDTADVLASARLNDLALVPGVASVALVYHQFEQPEALLDPLSEPATAIHGGISQ